MPNATDRYKVFVNGKLTTSGNNYDEVFQRGLGIAMYLNLEFENPRSGYLAGTQHTCVIDKWRGKNDKVLIVKN